MIEGQILVLCQGVSGFGGLYTSLSSIRVHYMNPKTHHNLTQAQVPNLESKSRKVRQGHKLSHQAHQGRSTKPIASPEEGLAEIQSMKRFMRGVVDNICRVVPGGGPDLRPHINAGEVILWLASAPMAPVTLRFCEILAAEQLVLVKMRAQGAAIPPQGELPPEVERYVANEARLSLLDMTNSEEGHTVPGCTIHELKENLFARFVYTKLYELGYAPTSGWDRLGSGGRNPMVFTGTIAAAAVV